MPKIVLGIYLVVGSLNIYAQYFDQHDLHLYTKPLLMPLLIFHLYRYSDGNITLPRMLLVAALLFSWLGDLLLMGSGDLYFLGGLVSFLVAHLFYAVVFYRAADRKSRLNALSLIPFLVFGLVILYILIPRTGNLALGIIIYAIGILIMAFMASIRKGVTSTLSFYLVFGGAILFVISDSLIAFDKFYNPIVHSDVMIMTTYIAAQLLIVRGVLIHQS
ncbi:MAG: lysoplasmalogenase [Cyclobacteriaceae bacterium]|nr:lysoplasmalogenase [Cyclobacteriaceae bacterium SS2]